MPERGYSNNRGIAFGVNSVAGPIRFVPKVSEMFVSPGGWTTHPPEDLQEAPLEVSEFCLIEKGVQEQAWEEAFTRSKDRVLNNRESMEKIRAENNAVLDKALDVVVQPVNLDLPPKA